LITFNVKYKKGKKTLKKKISLPYSWQEVNLKTMIRLRYEWDKKSTIQLFSILSGEDLEFIGNLKASQETSILLALDWVHGFDLEKVKQPKYLKIKDKVCLIPTDIEMETLGQQMAATQLIHQQGEAEVVSDVLAIYLQPIYDSKPFDLDRSKELRDDILNCSGIEAMKIADFFLPKSIAFTKNGLSESTLLRIASSKLLRKPLIWIVSVALRALQSLTISLANTASSPRR
jgi:hypothetical protein